MSSLSAFVTIFLASLVLVESTDNKCFSYAGEFKDVAEALGTGGFVKIGEGLYFIGKNKVNWFEASEICRRHNAQLASIETEAEMKSLSAYLTSEKLNEYYWLSGTDLHKEKDFIWMGTGQPLTYELWDKGQPDNYGQNENCMMLWLRNNEWWWNDLRCTDSHGYICEGKMPAFKYQFQFQFE